MAFFGHDFDCSLLIKKETAIVLAVEDVTQMHETESFFSQRTWDG